MKLMRIKYFVKFYEWKNKIKYLRLQRAYEKLNKREYKALIKECLMDLELEDKMLIYNVNNEFISSELKPINNSD